MVSNLKRDGGSIRNYQGPGSIFMHLASEKFLRAWNCVMQNIVSVSVMEFKFIICIYSDGSVHIQRS